MLYAINVINIIISFLIAYEIFIVNLILPVFFQTPTLQHFLLFLHFIQMCIRDRVVIRRTEFDLRKARERAHILEGLIIASDNIDEVIRIIRAADVYKRQIAYREPIMAPMEVPAI